MEILILIFLIFAIIQFDLVFTSPQAGYRATNEEARDSSPTAKSILGPVEPLEGGGENGSGKDGTQRSERDVVVIDEAERHRPRRPYGGGRDRFDRFDRYGGEFGDRYDRYGGRGGRYGGDRFGTGGIYGSRGIYEEVHPVLIPEPIPIPHPVPIPEPVPVPILAPTPSLLPPPIILRTDSGKK